MTASVAADVASPLGTTSLFTSYNHADGAPYINWLTCGRIPGSEGCYGSGEIGPFNRACAIASRGDTIYVADVSGVPDSQRRSETHIHVYQQVVSAAPSVTFVKTIDVPLRSSDTAKCWMAPLGDQLYFGTDQSPSFFDVDSVSGVVTSGKICGTPTTGIYSNGEYLIVEQGDCIAYINENGTQFSGGNSGHTFFPNGGASIPLQ